MGKSCMRPWMKWGRRLGRPPWAIGNWLTPEDHGRHTKGQTVLSCSVAANGAAPNRQPESWPRRLIFFFFFSLATNKPTARCNGPRDALYSTLCMNIRNTTYKAPPMCWHSRCNDVTPTAAATNISSHHLDSISPASQRSDATRCDAMPCDWPSSPSLRTKNVLAPSVGRSVTKRPVGFDPLHRLCPQQESKCRQRASDDYFGSLPSTPFPCFCDKKWPRFHIRTPVGEWEWGPKSIFSPPAIPLWTLASRHRSTRMSLSQKRPILFFFFIPFWWAILACVFPGSCHGSSLVRWSTRLTQQPL